MKKVLKVTFWIIALILFPITAGLYFIWPSKIYRDRISHNWKTFWWVIYAVLAFLGVASKVLICLTCFLMTYEDSGPIISRDDVPAPEYRTSEDFYKLTGVEFPELEMVDSLFFQDGGFPTSYWKEYKFVAKDGLSRSFYKSLERACETDSTHWHYAEGGSIYDYFYQIVGEPVIGDQMLYHYGICPDKEPVDRSRGMCDRMVEIDGEMIKDWDGTFISVDIVNDTIILREGWLH